MKNSEHTKELLKLVCKEEETYPSAIKDLDFISIMKIKSDLLEFFVRVRVQEDLTEKWKVLTKVNENKNEEGKRCTQTRQSFLIQ